MHLRSHTPDVPARTAAAAQPAAPTGTPCGCACPARRPVLVPAGGGAGQVRNAQRCGTLGRDVGPPSHAWLGLGLSFVSALIVSWAYGREHAAAVALPTVTLSHPLRSARLLSTDRRWMLGFAAEGGGWVVFMLALRLAPLALVQAVNASGVAVLAFLSTGGRMRRLGRRERLAVASAVLGLVLLALSLIGTTPMDRTPRSIPTVIWLAACLAAAATFAVRWPHIVRASTLGAAAGLLFAGGDTSGKLVVLGGSWLLAAVPLIIFYSLGSIQLQSAFQHGNILIAAGTANLVTNAVPIVAGIVLFRQVLPHGLQLVAQALAFAAILTGAMLLGDRARGVPTADEPVGQPNSDTVGAAVRHPC